MVGRAGLHRLRQRRKPILRDIQVNLIDRSRRGQGLSSNPIHGQRAPLGCLPRRALPSSVFSACKEVVLKQLPMPPLTGLHHRCGPRLVAIREPRRLPFTACVTALVM